MQPISSSEASLFRGGGGGGGGLIVVIFNVVPSESLCGGESHAAVIVEGTTSKHFSAKLRFGKSQEKKIRE